MSIDPIGGGGGMFSPSDSQSFGAQVATKTFDTLNGQGAGESLAPVDKQSFGGAVVSKTLDYMNAGEHDSSGMSQLYDFQTKVLGGHADSIAAGAMLDLKI